MRSILSSLLLSFPLLLRRSIMLRGDGNLYVLLVIGSVMAGAFALTGGLLPVLQKDPPASSQVEVDVDSARRSSENSLQLVDLKIKPSPTPPPPTPTVACLNRTVITLIIDLSASMDNNGKIQALNTAMSSFTKALENNTVIGGVAFGGENLRFGNTEGVSSLLNYTVYGTNQSVVNSTLTRLKAGPEGGTFMRNAFQVALSQLKKAKPNYPGYRHIAIIFSDGVPEMYDYRNPTCYARDGQVCWARQQDPRSTPYGMTGTDLIGQLDDEVEKVYSVGIYNSSSGTRGAKLTQNLRTLLGTIATKNTVPYFQAIDLKTETTGNLTSFFRSIVGDACT